jgi:hypothetical protein
MNDKRCDDCWTIIETSHCFTLWSTWNYIYDDNGALLELDHVYRVLCLVCCESYTRAKP